MKIAISYPPLNSKKGTPLLSQNRQFQWFNRPAYIYPVVPAYAATMLKQKGHQVFWLDGIAEEWTYAQWVKKVKTVQPDLLVVETKTPVVKQHWQIITKLKKTTGNKVKSVLVGDHVTALPQESFNKSKVDYVLTGGDWDFLLVNLVSHLEKGEKLEPGIWYREKKIKNTGRFELSHRLNKLPLIDRELTKWQLYAYNNGNYKKTPGAYTMVGRDCWHRKKGGCVFCSWATLYPKWRTRSPESLIEEIGELISKYQVKTIFDDTGSFLVGKKLRQFCQMMIKNGYHKKIDFGCNMRFDGCSLADYRLMKQAGFRTILFGLESANQKTLDRINKNLTVRTIKESCKKAKQAGIEPHITIMVGYPWESRREAQRTVDLGKKLLIDGFADTLQVTIIIPYPGTRLFEEAKKKKWLQTEKWEKYDMRQPILKTKIPNNELMKMVQEIYKVAFHPKFLLRKAISIRNINDIKFLLNAGKKVIGHLEDFHG